MKKLSLLMVLASSGLLLGCGGSNSTPAASSAPAAASSEAASSAPAAASSEAASSKETVSNKYEKIWNYVVPAEDGTYESLVDSKHSGPNYVLQLALEKDTGVATLSRKLVYMNMGSGDPFLNTAAGGFTVSGTWEASGDAYKVSLPSYEVARGVGTFNAVEITSAADGTITVPYAFGSYTPEGSSEAVNQTYETVMSPAVDLAGEYEGHYINDEKEDNPITGFEITAAADGAYTMEGSIEESGLSSFTAEIDSFGILSGVVTRLDGTLNGWCYKGADGKASVIMHMYARERHSIVYGTILL
ncbi:MAG: hypothetical protein K6F32_05535 [Bacilli bacterium]|nr:hypothetical protein [Bacilli bacterium]